MIARLRHEKYIRYVWSVQLNPRGRPNDVWCQWNVKADTLRTHELPITRLCLCYPEFDWTRGYANVNQEVKPDGEGIYLGTLHYLEYFSGEMTGAQIRRKVQKHYRNL